MFSPASSVAFNIGTFGVRFYSIIMFLAIVCGSVLTFWVAKKYYKNINLENLLDVFPVVIISAIVGARAYYVILDLPFYAQHPGEIFAVWHGGLSIHGALLGGFIGGFVYAKKHNLPLLLYADVFAYGLLLGQAIGRLGNFFNIEAFGQPCYFSEKICLYVPINYRPIGYSQENFFHPVFFYEMIWNICSLAIIFFIIRPNTKNRHGIVFFSYLILYSIGRLLIEHIRLDSVLYVFGLHIAEVVSLGLIIISVLMIMFLIWKESKPQ